MPLLLRGLDLPDPAIRASVINTLLSAAQAEVEGKAKNSKEGSVFAEHALSLATTMLRNCSVDLMPDAVSGPSRLPAVTMSLTLNNLTSSALYLEGARRGAEVPVGVASGSEVRCPPSAEGIRVAGIIEGVG